MPNPKSSIEMETKQEAETESELYFAMYEPEEKFFATIPHTDAIYESNAVVGDSLTFFWNKKKYSGTVRYVCDNYEECVAETLKLKAIDKKKNKRERSFHASSPRKSKVQCQQRVSNHLKRANKNTVTAPKVAPKKKLDPKDLTLKQVDQELLEMIKEKRSSRKAVKSSDDEQENVHLPSTSANQKSKGKKSEEKLATNIELIDSGTSSPSHSSSTSDNSDADTDAGSAAERKKSSKELELALKLSSQLAAKYDMNFLQDLAAGRVDPEAFKARGSPTSNKHQQPCVENYSPPLNREYSLEGTCTLSTQHKFPAAASNSMPAPKSVTAATHEADPVPLAVADSVPPAVADPVPNDALAQEAGLVGMYQGNMFIVTDPEEGVTLPSLGKAVYCTKLGMDAAEKSTSAPMAGRRLLTAVFTKEALSKCSLSGLPPRGKGKEAYANRSVIKPYLCPVAVQAIVDKALELQKSKHWHPKKDASQIRQAMSVRINEITPKSST